MGFSGHLVFGRSPRSLLEAPLFGGVGAGDDGVRVWKGRPGGWQTLELAHGIWRAERLPALVAWTGAPACFAEVHDSRTAVVTGLDADGHRWQARLNPDGAADLPDEIPVTAERALAWATAAGVRTSAERRHIEDVLRTRTTFAEDLFAALLDELDFPETPFA
ncbi:hypothetical protein [Streptomyces sp. NBC_00525]|uniref:hypothetical protein n=1 Tax=Streptomyces sp. NBC_00525 TaxID=2903660 RepID=UPI002E819CF5|nr:hypothetical protein [Streptomyces sp. NBC_00525]WUC95199.1 hypothetical protein OG710_17115 [Streptomyces sp. NBC_00525]